MTSLERAARAMCEVRGADGLPLLNADPDFGDYPLTEEGTDDLNPFTEVDVLALVRAVLQAIREPSEAMVCAGVAGIDEVEGDCATDYGTTAGWRAMIDAALEER